MARRRRNTRTDRWSLRKHGRQLTAFNEATGARVTGSAKDFRTRGWAEAHGVPEYIMKKAGARKVRRNTHLTVGAAVKYSRSYLKLLKVEEDELLSGFSREPRERDWAKEEKRLKSWRGTILQVLSPGQYLEFYQRDPSRVPFTLGGGYYVAGRSLQQGARALPDHALVAADSDTRTFPGTGYKGKTPRRNAPRRNRRRNREDRWIVGVEKEMQEHGTVGSFTRQARKAGYSNTMEFARKVMKGWRSGRKTVKNKKTGKQQKISLRTMRRALFAINADAWRG